jgi:hypothetical protein
LAQFFNIMRLLGRRPKLASVLPAPRRLATFKLGQWEEREIVIESQEDPGLTAVLLCHNFSHGLFLTLAERPYFNVAAVKNREHLIKVSF